MKYNFRQQLAGLHVSTYLGRAIDASCYVSSFIGLVLVSGLSLPRAAVEMQIDEMAKQFHSEYIAFRFYLRSHSHSSLWLCNFLLSSLPPFARSLSSRMYFLRRSPLPLSRRRLTLPYNPFPLFCSLCLPSSFHPRLDPYFIFFCASPTQSLICPISLSGC